MPEFLKRLLLRGLRKILTRYLAINFRKLKNRDFTLIANNCVGGVIYNDLGLRFKSPTINLYFYCPDYITFLEDFDFCLQKEISIDYKSKYHSNPCNYPIGHLEDVEIHFLHYESIEEAHTKWEERKSRIDRKNLFILGSDRDLCDNNLIARFASLPFDRKVIFSSKPLEQDCSVYFPEYRLQNQVGDLIADDKGWYYHCDLIHWLNTGDLKINALIRSIFLLYRRFKKGNGITK